MEPNAFLAVRLTDDIRLYRSVGPGCSSQRKPRLTVSFEVARQSFCEYTATYFCEKAGSPFAPGRIHHDGAPTRSAAPLTPFWLLFEFCGATQIIARRAIIRVLRRNSAARGG